jgi:1A family penicillin-binding protein
MNSLPENKLPARPERSWTTRVLRNEWSDRCPPWCRKALTVLLVLLCVAIIPVALMTAKLPDRKEIKETGYATKTTRFYDASDKYLLSIDKEERTPVPLSAVSPHMVKAVIAIEDQRFYNHLGVDVVRMGSALMTDIKERRFAEGASTITQQLARQMFLDDRKTLWRKGREIIVAFRIERQFKKDKILELYLNEVYFGHGYYGVEAAARGYFGKPASALTLPESALLAGLIKAPSHYSPRAHLEKSQARRAIVLDQMVDAGYIDRQTAEQHAKAPVVLTRVAAQDPFASYFKKYVLRTLVERLGEEAVFEGGLRVYTTLDPDLQRAAETALKEGLTKVEAQPRYRHSKQGTAWRARSAASASPYVQGALVAMTPDGRVAALVGGRDSNDSAFDRATQAKRQPGSAFKPFIYAAALESGLTPSTLLTGLSPRLDDPAAILKPAAWWPREAHESTTDEMTVRNALRTSSNRAAALVLTQVGLPRVMSYAKQFGFNPPPYPSMVLGTGEVTVLHLTAAYAAFANAGRVPTPIAIRRVEDRYGTVIMQDMPSETQAISAVTAFQTAEMLAEVINSGSGYAVRRVGFKLPAGGKTGTTDDFRDAWFAGFTPELVATVWVGFDDPRTIVNEGFGGDLAAPIWGRFMALATKSKTGGWINPPAGLVTAKICKLSGLLANPECGAATAADANGVMQTRSYVTNEYFRAGTAPTMFCNIHGVLEPVSPDFYFDRALYDQPWLGRPSSEPPASSAAPARPAPDAVTEPRVLDLPAEQQPPPTPAAPPPPPLATTPPASRTALPKAEMSQPPPPAVPPAPKPEPPKTEPTPPPPGLGTKPLEETMKELPKTEP